eukprot:1192165-Prorocentrum_minimum.AAC.4
MHTTASVCSSRAMDLPTIVCAPDPGWRARASRSGSYVAMFLVPTRCLQVPYVHYEERVHSFVRTIRYSAHETVSTLFIVHIRHLRTPCRNEIIAM